ncbi:ribonuclease P protein component [Mycobacterium sp.]|uniref:ribonuclease P protein component n=1 Tax=Mycobacterium sp. TaxID=1785 RepID=UPI0025D1FEEB|nr:ribonuclease P protein component [Mycobacterium sp.]MBW0013233.1 ribonuclease P protein component [Mycobacterium sp.]
MLPARNRMRQSSEFDATVKYGVRRAQPDVIVHVRRANEVDPPGPRVGLIISKKVGSAVERHRVARRLRHVARTLLSELDRRDRVVIRALPTSREASSARLEQELRHGLRHALESAGYE